MINVNKLQTAFEKNLTPAVSLYSQMTNTVTGLMVKAAETLEDMIRRMFGESALPPKPAGTRELTPEQQEQRQLSLNRRAAEIVGERLAKTGEQIDAATFESRVAAEAARLSEQEGMTTRYLNRLEMLQNQDRADRELGKAFSSAEGFANGGVLSGPKSGYLAKLHGIEAVVPLSENRKIPVEINQTATESTTTNFDSLIEVVKEQTNKFDNLLASNAEMLRVLQQSRDITRDLRDNYA